MRAWSVENDLPPLINDNVSHHENMNYTKRLILLFCIQFFHASKSAIVLHMLEPITSPI
jgi:hypothetical protein